jgi:hypothetical protein
MTSIPITDILTIIFVLVDDWYQSEGHKLMQGKAGRKPEFKDSEVMTLMLAQDFIPFPSETQYIGYLRANYLGLFPKLVDQSQFNRRARGAAVVSRAVSPVLDRAERLASGNSFPIGYQTDPGDGV